MYKVLFLIAIFITNLFGAKNIWISTGEAYGIEPRLLYAISKVESNTSALVISVNHTKMTQAQANNLYRVLNYKKIPYKTLTKVVQIQNRNKQEATELIKFLDYYKYTSFDIGLMQINNMHKESLTKKNISLYALLDEKVNLSVGAQILWDCYKKHGSKENAINAYNGKITGNDYYQKVYAELEKLLLPHENKSKNLFYRVL